MKRAVFIVALIGAAAAGAVLYLKYTAADPTTSFRTAAIRYGDLLSTIGATGTVEPEEVVDVGAQVMGSILGFGTDPQNPTKLVDYGCVVEKGTVLARIDPAIYEAQKKSAEAALVSAKADLPQKIAQLAQATADWGRVGNCPAPSSRRSTISSRRPMKWPWPTSKSARPTSEWP